MPVLGGYAITVNWGSAAGVFTKITGIKADTAVLDQNVSSEKGSPKILKIPGKYGCYPVTLSAGYMEQLQAEGPWWAGLKKIQDGEIGSTRADCTITFWSTAKVPGPHRGPRRTPGRPSGAPATSRSRRASSGSRPWSSSASP